MSRRSAVKALGLLSCTAAFPACLSSPPAAALPVEPRLTARPGAPTQSGSAGKHQFDVPASSAVIYVPQAVQRTSPTGLLVFLHGALRTVDFFVDGHRAGADSSRVIVLAPYASNGTWDAISGAFSRDVEVLNATLQWTFNRWSIDPARIVMSGFSDGGTYSLGIGRANGDLFTRVVAYSPGFLLGVDPVGKPPILISHGTSDTVLPIDATSRLMVPQLRSLGYAVDYREFDGGHAVPMSVLNEVLRSLA